MPNLSQLKRQRMLAFLDKIKEENKTDDEMLIAIGEIGLAGECRGVSHVEQRVREAARLGFTDVLLPTHNAQSCPAVDGIEVHPVKNIYDILKFLKGNN